MAPESLISMLAASVVDDVFQNHGGRLNDLDMASRKAEEAASRRYEAASWLRKTVGVVRGKELPEQPSEDEFRLGLRSGFILCTVLNKIQPGAIPKIVACPGDLVDETALSAYQYFENIRNFLVAAQEMGLPIFEASDLEKGGNSARIVNSVLALKSYSEWQQSGGHGFWKYGGNLKPVNLGKFFVRKNSEPFINSLRNLSMDDKLQEGDQGFLGKYSHESTETAMSCSLSTLLSGLGSDKNPEEVPKMLQSMLEKVMGLVMEELGNRMSSETQLIRTSSKDLSERIPCSPKRKVLAELVATPVSAELQRSDENKVSVKEDRSITKLNGEELKHRIDKESLVFEQQQKDIQELKHRLYTIKVGVQFMQSKYSEDLCTLGKQFQSLTRAASGYHKVLEENRRLYNQIQDLKGSIRVYCRVRPFLPGQSSFMSTVGHLDDESIAILTPSKNGKEVRKSFNFNKVLGPSATQEDVFSDTQPLIRSVLDGFNVCIFAYGQTGSGKTYTMSGPNNLTTDSQGVNYRALGDLFYLSEQRRDTFIYDISVQMIEIYNEQVRDLLSTDGHTKKLEIRNSSQNGLNVPDANLVPVASTSEVIELMDIGQKNRAVGSTALNDRSSRSHSCLTVHVQGKELATGTVLRGCMHLVDLAGSERVNKSEVTGDRLKEAQHINKSLSALGDVIAALAQKNQHVPYRNSKLTQLLQDSLGGQAKTLMFVHISPEADAVGETLSTLKFAERVSNVELGSAKRNKESSEVKELKEQIASLKEALAKKNVEPEQFQNVIPRPEMQKNRSGDSSPMHPREDGNARTRGNSTRGQKKPGSNLPAHTMNGSSPWPSCNGKDEKDPSYEDWLEKIMQNKTEARDDDSSGGWSGETPQLSDSFRQNSFSEMGAFFDQQYIRNGISRNGSGDYGMRQTLSESATTVDSDDFDYTTMDSSEADLMWQFNQRNFTQAINGSMSKTKKPKRIPQESGPETRTLIKPSPSRTLSNGSLQTPKRTGRRQVEAKNQSSGGNVGSRK